MKITLGLFVIMAFLSTVVCNAEDKLPPEDQALQMAINRFTQCQIDNITSHQEQVRIWLGQYNRLIAEQERLKKELSVATQEKGLPKEESK